MAGDNRGINTSKKAQVLLGKDKTLKVHNNTLRTAYRKMIKNANTEKNHRKIRLKNKETQKRPTIK